MADDPKPISIKPIVIKPKISVSPGAAAPGATLRLKPVVPPTAPAAAPVPAAPKPAPAVLSAMKGKTSRISLDESEIAHASESNAAMGKITANLSKDAAPKPAAPAAAPVPPAPKPSPAVLSAMKGKTSRISLDDAMLAQAASANAAMGKLTKNLTKEAAAVPASAAPRKIVVGGTPQSTMRIADPAAVKPVAAPTVGKSVGAGATPTIRRQPIAVKSAAPTIRRTAVPAANTGAARPGFKLRQPGAAPATAAAPAAAPASAEASKPAEASTPAAASARKFAATPARKENKALTAVAAVFALLALATTITCCVLFASEACGPDRTLTQYSSFRTLPTAEWPGKIHFR